MRRIPVQVSCYDLLEVARWTSRHLLNVGVVLRD